MHDSMVWLGFKVTLAESLSLRDQHMRRWRVVHYLWYVYLTIWLRFDLFVSGNLNKKWGGSGFSERWSDQGNVYGGTIHVRRIFSWYVGLEISNNDGISATFSIVLL